MEFISGVNNMDRIGPCYALGPGSQVREEDFGLLFYTMAGPRLYFVSSEELLSSDFFLGKHTLRQWIEQKAVPIPVRDKRVVEIEKTLHELRRKGVIIEC